MTANTGLRAAGLVLMSGGTSYVVTLPTCSSRLAGLMDGTIMVGAARARRGVSAFFSSTRSLGKYERRDRAERRVKCAIQIIQQ